jgi:hypothetical protein
MFLGKWAVDGTAGDSSLIKWWSFPAMTLMERHRWFRATLA